MFRALLTLLLAVPLLTPPGVCLCHCEWLLPSTPACRSESCQSCRHTPADPPHEHAPTCPALKTAASAKTVAVVAPVVDLDVPSLSLPVAEPVTVRPDPFSSAARFERGPPAYITFRTLRI